MKTKLLNLLMALILIVTIIRLPGYHRWIWVNPCNDPHWIQHC
jgi:hypothetical protein